MSNKDKRILHSAGGSAETMINVGYGNYVSRNRVVAIMESGSLPIRRLREKAAGENCLLDATSGRKMRSLIITDSNHVVISSLAPHTLQERLRSEGRISPALLEFSGGEFVS